MLKNILYNDIMTTINFKKKEQFINYINDILNNCLYNKLKKNIIKCYNINTINLYISDMASDQYDENSITELWKKNIDDGIKIDQFKLLFFYIKKNKKIISRIFTYYFFLNDKIYMGVHSKTEKGYEGNKYNQLLRYIIILATKYIKIDDKYINIIGSEAINPISGHIWREKLKFKYTNLMYSFVNIKNLTNVSIIWLKKYKKNNNKEMFIQKLRSRNPSNTNFNEDLLVHIFESKKKIREAINDYIKNRLDQYKYIKDYTIIAIEDAITGFNYFQNIDDDLRNLAFDNLIRLRNIGKNCINLKLKNI